MSLRRVDIHVVWGRTSPSDQNRARATGCRPCIATSTAWPAEPDWGTFFRLAKSPARNEPEYCSRGEWHFMAELGIAVHCILAVAMSLPQRERATCGRRMWIR